MCDSPRTVEVVTALCPASTRASRADAPEGLTITGVLEHVRCGLSRAPGLRVFLDGEPVPRERWRAVSPSAGQRVLARVVPADGGGDDDKVLRTVLLIAITVVSLGTSSALLGAAIQVGGVIAINALVPPPTLDAEDAEKFERTPLLSGARNRLNPYSPIPVVLGKHRITPPLGAQPYTELDQSEQYLRMLVIPGYGPLEIADLRIAETPLDSYDNVDVELLSGYDDDPALSIFPNTVVEDSVGVLLKETTDWVTRRTEADIDEIGVELTFPEGLIQILDGGSRIERTVDIEAEYKLVGNGGWKTAGDTLDVPQRSFESAHFTKIGWWFVGIDKNSGRIAVFERKTGGGGLPDHMYLIARVDRQVGGGLAIIDERDAALTTYGAGHFLATNTPDVYHVQVAAGKFDTQFGFSQTARVASTLRVGQTIRVANGQYDVRIRRTTTDSTISGIYDEAYWTVLRSIKDADPVAMSGVAKLAVRIRATDQLQGMVDELNCIAQSIAKDWDSATSAWVERATSNPASLYRLLLQGPMNKRPVADARIDLAALQTWHEWCESNGIEYNSVLDYSTTLYQALRDVASVGRASPTMKDGLFSVVQDVAQSTPRQLFTPKNSWGFTARRGYAEMPHALKVQFVRGLPTHEVRATPANVEVGDVFALEFGDTTLATFTATAATVANVVTGLKAAWDASSERIAALYDATDDATHLTLTGSVPSAQYLIEGTATNGGATDDQTLTVEQQNTAGTWEQDEIVVYDDGYDAANARKFETLRLKGVANEDQAWKTGRYHLAALRLRPEMYEINTDVEHIVCSRGDLVRVQHDVPLFGLSTGRVKSRTEVAGTVTTITLDETVTMTSGSSYAVRFRQADGTVLLENVDTDVGEKTTLTFSTAPATAGAPDVGDLVSFGKQGSETVEMIVHRIEMGSDLTAKLVLVDAAPGIHAADSGAIPAYNPQITVAPRLEELTPATPEIVSLRSGVAVMIRHKDGTFENRILATVRAGSGGVVPAARFEAQFRLSDSTRWIELPDAPADATEFSVVPVEDGEDYDVRVRARSAWGVASAWDTVEDHTVLGTMEIGTDFINIANASIGLAGRAMTHAYVGEDGALYAPVDIAETWTTHFTARSWSTIQDQIDAGYPYFLQPTKTIEGSWEALLDFGGIIYHARIRTIIKALKIAGDVEVTPTISVSADDIEYTEYAGSEEINVTGFRYVKVKYEFLAADDTGYVRVTTIGIQIDARTRIDSALVALSAGDSGGTQVSFGRDFLSVEAIVATPKDSSASYFCVVNFDYDTVNPTTFKLMMFNQAGTRVSGDATYVARGY